MDNVDTLPVLGYLSHTFKRSPIPIISDTVFVCVQHLLPTSVDLFRSLISLGANPKNIFLMGKYYSTCESVVSQLSQMDVQLQCSSPSNKLGDYENKFNNDLQNLWNEAFQHTAKKQTKAIVVLDDGGRCLDFIHQDITRDIPIVGIEQTSAGLFNPKILNLPVPFIDVATCAAKSKLEPEIITYELLSSITKILPEKHKESICGIVGSGTIGYTLANKLLELGYQVIVYDKNEKKLSSSSFRTASSLKNLLHEANYIIGCTGRDITDAIDVNTDIIEDKFFISCSSEDKEFLTLLKYIQKKNRSKHKTIHPLDNITFQIDSSINIHILNGGFPINFNRQYEIAMPEMIQLTRGLLLGAVIQALAIIMENKQRLHSGRIALNHLLQKYIVQTWTQHNELINTSLALIEKFSNYDWIIDNSPGQNLDSTYLTNCFEDDSTTFETLDLAETTS